MDIPNELAKIIGDEAPLFDPTIHYAVGKIAEPKQNAKGMVFSGWLSTPDVDLSNEVIDVAAFPPYIDWYKRNPLYCYNHDISMPVGKVMDVQIVNSGEKSGLYLNDITLSKIAPVEEYLWPLIQDGVLTQQSIGFYSLRGKQIGDVYHHTLVYVLEGSLVPVACNPQAVIDNIKCLTKGAILDPSFKTLETVEDLMDAYQKGVLRLPSEVRSNHFVSGLKLAPTEGHKYVPGDLVETSRPEDDFKVRTGTVAYVIDKVGSGMGKNGGQETRDAQPGNPAVMVEEVDKDLNTTGIALPCNASELTLLKTVKELGDKSVTTKTPDFADIVVLKATSPVDAEGAEVSKPRKNQKGYSAVCENIFAAKSEARGSYLFQIGVPTEKGYRYDWKSTAMAMARALGAAGGFHMSADQKAAVIERIGESYEALGKAVPTVSLKDHGESYDLKVTEVEPAVLIDIPYEEVKWLSDEPAVVQVTLFKNDITRAAQTIQSWTKDGGTVPEDAKLALKDLYGYVSLDVWAYMSDPDGVDLLMQVLAVIQQGNAEDAAEDAADGEEGTYVFLMDAPDGESKTPNWAMIAKAFVDKAIAEGQLTEETLSKSVAEAFAAPAKPKSAESATDSPSKEIASSLKRLLA